MDGQSGNVWEFVLWPVTKKHQPTVHGKEVALELNKRQALRCSVQEHPYIPWNEQPDMGAWGNLNLEGNEKERCRDGGEGIPCSQF